MGETPPGSGPVDLFVIGGGINGCGIARDAAGRGLSVTLAEQGDLAEATSSASTKLFHGGLRYLEYFEFRLVRESLVEREVLLRAMPHISWPMRFVLPYHPEMRFESETPTSRLLARIMPWMKGRRPAWLIRLGLFLYDHLGGRKILPGTRTLDLRRDPAGQPAEDGFEKAFEYSDCWVEDSRLVVLNARDAEARGATILTRARVVSAERAGDLWRITLDRGGTRAVVDGARAGQCRRPLGRRRDPRGGAHQLVRTGAPGARQPYRHPQALRPRQGLFLPGHRRAHHLRHTLRARLHPDRHDGSGARGRAARRGLHRGGAGLSLPVRLAVFRRAGDARRHRLDLFGGAPAL